jgi:hypothetical protein
MDARAGRRFEQGFVHAGQRQRAAQEAPMNPNDKRTNNEPRSPEGKRIGGHTRAINQTEWGCAADLLKVPNAQDRSSPYVNIGSHADAPAKPLRPGASEGNPCGFPPAVKGRR